MANKLTGSGAGGPYPNAINRANADIGRSRLELTTSMLAQIDTFRIYNSALTMTQAQALYQQAASVVARSLVGGSTTANSATARVADSLAATRPPSPPP